jgi:hypothetical protein
MLVARAVAGGHGGRWQAATLQVAGGRGRAGGTCTAPSPSRRDLQCPRAGSPAHRPAGQRRSRSGAALPPCPPAPPRLPGPRSAGTAGRGARPGGEPGPPEQTFYQLNGRHGERVTRLPPARLRPAAMRQPAALLHLADMTILLLSAGSAAFSALPWQASMETHTQMAQFSARGSRWADIPRYASS